MQVDCSYYAAMPAALYSEVTVRVYEREVEILDDHGEVLRRHPRSTRKGHIELPEEDRGRYNTVAGLLMFVSGHLPEVGERIDCAGWCFEVNALEGDELAEGRLVAGRLGEIELGDFIASKAAAVSEVGFYDDVVAGVNGRRDAEA